MKKTNAALSVLFCAAILFVQPACRLARENEFGNSLTSDGLAGVLVTSEPLDSYDFTGDTGNDPKAGDSNATGDGNMYYATFMEERRADLNGMMGTFSWYEFEGLPGIFCFSCRNIDTEWEPHYYYTTYVKGGLHDSHVYENTLTADTITMEGAIYIPTGWQGNLYFNPIYQAVDGRLYAMQGESIQSGSETMPTSRTMKDQNIRTLNGEQISRLLSVTIFVEALPVPEKITVMSMDPDGMLISRNEYGKDSMPESLSPPSNCEYLVVESSFQDSSGKERVSLGIYGRDSNIIEAAIDWMDGICLKSGIRLLWTQE